MLHPLKSAIRRSKERAQKRREYELMLRLEDHVLRDLGIDRDDIRARMTGRHAA
jgi:uncharacterized protein YjiS (DUF1127 family)